MGQRERPRLLTGRQQIIFLRFLKLGRLQLKGSRQASVGDEIPSMLEGRSTMPVRLLIFVRFKPPATTTGPHVPPSLQSGASTTNSLSNENPEMAQVCRRRRRRRRREQPFMF